MTRRRKRSVLANLRAVIANKNSRIGHMACTLCDHYILGNWIYVTILGLIGTVITAFDIIRIINCKTSVMPSSQTRDNETVPLNVERDLKLMTSILGLEHYTLITLGAIIEYPMLYTPWLTMQLSVIILELIVFCGKVFLEGLHMKHDEILLSILTVHNWLQVFCLLQKQIRQAR
ncbi:uncharacterized protein LOC108629729 isoform X3 [Ceratina calcarata]|uniref:Uncharacterized protein LOC108629729 isoform X3 n=1 Tax=Ceratina calcarata TaxID=156304 RepID=A0AAJ7JAM8_9HYME|nr:uncharacterized protein LOC108629729 isoform X3 [Ceratina calcarata]